MFREIVFLMGFFLGGGVNLTIEPNKESYFQEALTEFAEIIQAKQSVLGAYVTSNCEDKREFGAFDVSLEYPKCSAIFLFYVYIAEYGAIRLSVQALPNLL